MGFHTPDHQRDRAQFLACISHELSPRKGRGASATRRRTESRTRIPVEHLEGAAIRSVSILLVLFAAALLAVGGLHCRPDIPGTLRVFAAASLTDAFRELGIRFEQLHEEVHVEMQFAGSQVLRTQIEQGAPGDVFASANEIQMNALVDAGLVRTPRVLVHNRIVAIVPASGGGVVDLPDLAGAGTRISMAAESVPVGHYGRLWLKKLESLGGYGQGFAGRVESNVISYETNVRAVLTRVILGEADAGIVYSTDAVGAGRKVRLLQVPEGTDVIASYYIAVVRRDAVPSAAEEFVSFVLGEAGQDLLKEYGFLGK